MGDKVHLAPLISRGKEQDKVQRQYFQAIPKMSLRDYVKEYVEKVTSFHQNWQPSPSPCAYTVSVWFGNVSKILNNTGIPLCCISLKNLLKPWRKLLKKTMHYMTTGFKGNLHCKSHLGPSPFGRMGA